MEERILWLLQNAGPHRSCELATFLGMTTGEVEVILSLMSRRGEVVWQEVGSQKRWRLPGAGRPFPDTQAPGR